MRRYEMYDYNIFLNILTQTKGLNNSFVWVKIRFYISF